MAAYLCSIIAINPSKKDSPLVHRPLVAYNKDGDAELVKALVEEAVQNDYPSSEGWQGHHVSVIEYFAEELRAILDQARSMEEVKKGSLEKPKLQVKGPHLKIVK